MTKLKTGDHVRANAGMYVGCKGIVDKIEGFVAIVKLIGPKGLYPGEEWKEFRGTDGRPGYMTLQKTRWDIIEKPKPKPVRAKNRMEDLIL